jgi:hypothetical protein
MPTISPPDPMNPREQSPREQPALRGVPSPVRVLDKGRLVWRIIVSFWTIAAALRRRPLPEVVAELRVPPHASGGPYVHPRRMGQIVYRVLRVGPFKARCLFTSLVLFRLLREQGDPVELVIGLPREPRDKDAHAWIEIGGVDVGPPPGKGRHEQLARYS